MPIDSRQSLNPRYTLQTSNVSGAFAIENEFLQRLLQSHGISPTTQRVEIAQILLSKRQHLSADQVMATLDTKAAAVSKATVYNTLRLFAERGLVRQVIVDPAKVFYDTNVQAHHHFYNIDDGTLIDVDQLALPLTQIPKLPSGTIIDAIDVVIRVSNITE
jgi:Fur family iron response transcriptional regulator